MELKDYLRILRRRGWIIVLVALLTAGSAYGFSRVQTKEYKASAKLGVNPARADWGLSNTAKDLLRSYTENYLYTYKMAGRVIDRAQLDMSPDTFLSRVAVSSDASTFSIQIDARDQDPQVAKLMAQTMGNVFVEDRTAWNQQQDKRDRIDVFLVDDVRDASIYRPQPLQNSAAGAVLGLLIGGLIVFALEWLEADILHTHEAVERTLGLTVLGAIPVEPGLRRTRAGTAVLRRVPGGAVTVLLAVAGLSAALYFMVHRLL